MNPYGEDCIIKERMLRNLKANVREHWGVRGDPDKDLREMYLKEPDGCLPDEYLGDDVSQDIINKFYWFLYAIRSEFEEFVEIYVVPSYESETVYLMVHGLKLLVKGHAKAWNFWCENEEELMDFMYSVYFQISTGLQQEG